MIRIRYLLLCLLPWIFQYTCAQSPHIQSITVSDGLSQGHITALCQDSHGFMWIGTFDGLNRFDGYSIRRFNYQASSQYSLSSSAFITAILEDHSGLLWIGTNECLYVFDPATERFFNINAQLPQLPGQYINYISEDKSGAIIVHIEDKQDSIGLFQIIQPTHFAAQLRNGKQPLEGIRAERLSTPPGIQPPVYLESCIGDSLILVRDKTGRGYRVNSSDHTLSPIDLLAFSASDNSIIWCKNYGFVFRRQLSDAGYTLTRPKDWRDLVRLSDGSRISFIGTENWLYKYNAAGILQSSQFDAVSKSEVFKKEFIPILELPYGINIIYRDRSDVLWVGTGGHGLFKVNLRNLAFRHYLPGSTLYNFRQLPDGRIWPGKFNSNRLINLHTGQFEKAPWASYFDQEYIYNVLPDRAGNMWFVTAGNITGKIGGIYFWEKTSGQYRKLASLPAFNELIAEQMLEDHFGNVWIAAHDGDLFRCSPHASSVEHFNYLGLFPETDKNLTVNAILEDKDESIWIGSSRGLLQVLHSNNNSTPTYRLIQHQSGSTQSLSWNWILCLCQDPTNPNVLWIGTRGGGLNRLDKSTGYFTHFTETDGLADNVVYGIIPDDNGNLWCSTNRGLSRFTPNTGHFVNYSASDGLQDDEFNTGASLRSKNGTLLFGGVNGLTAFNPQDIHLSSLPPPVAITNIKVLGKLLLPAREDSPLQFAPYFEQTLTLPFSENNISFEFAALDFANPGTNRYRYRMDGIDRAWIASGTAHTANYISLPPGAYTFMVQATTADGDWNPESARFRLVIAPPWYRSWLAYCFYFLVVLCLSWIYFTWRSARLREQEILQDKNQEAGRLEELDSFKNQQVYQPARKERHSDSSGQTSYVADFAEGTFEKEDEFIRKLYQIFEENYADEHFKLEQLCRLTGMSSSQLHRKLTALTDQPAMQMLRNFRLNKARELLQTHPNVHVNQIAMKVGFPNPSQFSRMFSKTFGMSPSEFKNQSR